MIVYVFDSRWPMPHTPPARHRPGDAVATGIVGALPIRSVIRDVQNAVTFMQQGRRSIWLLRLCAHGNAGYLELGEGLNSSNAPLFADLAEWMTPGGRGVELHGCAVASDASPPLTVDPYGRPACAGPGTFRGTQGQGYELLLALANAVRAPVKAAINCQNPDPNFRFEGPTITVYPGGRTVQSLR